MDVQVSAQHGKSVATANSGTKKVVTATEADTYTVTVTPKEGYRWENPTSNTDTDPITYTFTIAPRKIGLEVIIPTGTSATVPYGTPFALTGNAKDYWKYAIGTLENDSDYSASATYKFLSGDDETKFTVSTPAAFDSGAVGVGKYPLYLTFTGDSDNYAVSFKGNFTAAEDSSYTHHNGAAATVEVVKAKLTVTANNHEISYGDVAADNGVRIDGFVNNETDSVLGGALTFTFGNYAQGSPKGNYVITPSGYQSDNYTFDYKQGTLSVKARAITLQIGSASHVYGGNVGSFSIGDPTGNWVNDGDKETLFAALTFVLQKQGSQVILSSTLDVGKYDVTAESKVYGNYDVTFASGIYEVTAKPITLAIGNSGHVFGSAVTACEVGDPDGGWVKSGDKEAVLASISFLLKSQGTQVTLTSTSPVGIYEVTAENKVYGNYNVTFVAGTYRISNATLNVDEVVWDVSNTYALGADLQPVKYQIKIDETRIFAVGDVKVTVTYDNLVAASGGYSRDENGVFLVSKAGTYAVTVTISAPNHDTVTRTLRMTINKATAVVLPTYDNSEEIWTSGVLPAIDCVAEVNGRAVQGKISWTTSLGSIKEDGYADFGWQWIPADDNIEIATGTLRIFVRFAAVRGIAIDFEPGDREFFETDALSDLKNYLTVTVTFTDGKTRVLGMNEYDLSCLGNAYLVAGDNVSVTISYLSAGSPVTQSFNLKVKAVEKPDPTPNPGGNKDPIGGMNKWFEETPLPLGYAALVLGAELLIIIILAIAARKPKED